MTDHSRVGRRIKELRLRYNLTLKQIESRVQVSATHVSEIERGKTSPTVGALNKIARAMDVDPALFLREDRMPAAMVVRAGERRSVYFEKEGVRIHPLSAGLPEQDLSAGFIEMEPESETPPQRHHAGEEFLLILDGQIEVDIEGTRHQLRPGDSFHFRSELEHRISNHGQTTCRALWASTPRFGI